MEQREHGARLLGLLVVAALGAMAFAANAQAVAPGFLIGKKAVGALLATVTGVQEGVGTMLVPGLNFKLSCTAMTTDVGAIENNTHAIATLLYTGCTMLSITKSPEEIHCHVTEPIKAEALLLPAELKKPVLDAPAILAEKVKALFMLHLPGASLGVNPCVFPLDNSVTGEICFEVRNSDTAEPLLYTDPSIECLERVALEGAQGVGVRDLMKFGAQAITFDIAARLFLTGAHLGNTLGVSLF
jgi:hypothetical protein